MVGFTGSVVSATGTRPAYVFIDSAYLRKQLDDMGVEWANLNLLSVARVALREVGSSWQESRLVLSRVYVYDSIRSEADNGAVEAWLTRVDQLNDTHVRRGFIAGDPQSVRPDRQRQKNVDVQLAVDAMNAAYQHAYDVAILVTGDGDFTALAEGIRNLGPLVAVAAFRTTLSDVLKIAADRVGYLSDEPAAWQGWLDLPE